MSALVLSSTAIWALAGLAAVLMLVFFLDFYRKEEGLGEMRSQLNLESKSQDWIQKKAQQLIRVEAFRTAGDLYDHLGRHKEAADLYLKGKNYIRAAEAFIKTGRKADAAKIYEALGEGEKAAECYLEARELSKAAETQLRMGDVYRAAGLFEQGGDFLRAAQAFEASAFYRRASRLYEKAGKVDMAAEALKRSCEQERSILTEEVSARDSRSFKSLCYRSGSMYMAAGMHDKAIEAFEQGGHFRDIGRAYEEGGMKDEAVEAFIKAGLPLEAARVLEDMGQSGRAESMRARFYIDRGQKREALEHLEGAGEYEEAARIHEEFGEPRRAADLYAKAGNYAKAGTLYVEREIWDGAAECMEKAGDWKEAAECWGRAGEFTRQAEAYERGADFLAAGENYYHRGLLDKAIKVLQQVDYQDPVFSRSSSLLGQIFKEKGMLNLAKESYRLVVENRDVGRSNLEDYYNYASCAEKAGDLEEAMRVYEKILGVDFHYQDVHSRLDLLKQQRTQVDSRPEQVYEETQAGQEITSPQPVTVEKSIRYEIMEEVGRGGMGIVYKARDSILDRIVAYKVLPANLKDHPQALRNFFREAKSAAKLNQTNIVTVYDAGEEAGNYYITMEFIEGETIKELINKEGRLPLKAVLLIAGQVCRALEYAHRQKVVHRDIKSSNIMWTRDKAVKLMDFGLAKVLEEVRGYQTVASGTPYYMSPEQTLGRDIDYRTDLYSLGITMFEMATGTLPFSTGDAAYHHVHTPPPEAISIQPDLPDSLNRIILKCMQKNPDRRFQSATELFEALKKVRD